MENASMQSPNDQNRKSKALLYTIIGVLLALNAGLFYFWQKRADHDIKTTAQNESLKKDTAALNRALEQAEYLITKYKRDSAALNDNNKDLSKEVMNKKNELVKLYAQLKNDKNASSAQIKQLQEKIKELMDQLANLEKQNTELKEVNAKLESENVEVIKRNKELASDRQKYKNIAQRLQATGLKVEALKKKWLSGKTGTTNKAKDVEAIRVSFSLAENKVAEAGEKIVYVKITGPEGVTLTNPGKEGGTFEYENNESKYTYKMSVLYEQDAKAAEVTKWSPNRDLKKGKYSIELYCEGFKIGEQVLDLK
jgi:predicted RNase H-like nuclease (RuvC/YqgF family)